MCDVKNNLPKLSSPEVFLNLFFNSERCSFILLGQTWSSTTRTDKLLLLGCRPPRTLLLLLLLLLRILLLQCFGQNDYGQLGQGDTIARGHNTSTMGDNLASVNLGAGGSSVIAMSAGSDHTCVILLGGSMKVRRHSSHTCV